MARRGWLVLLCSLASCPPPPPPPECPPTASVELRVWLPLATGPQAVPTVTRADAGLVETTLRLVRSDGGLAAESGPTFAREFTWDFETPEADAYHLTYAATCDGRLLDEGRWLYSVYARLQLDRSLPRGCGRLTRLSPELLECDGVVVTQDGGLSPGFRESADGDTRPVLRDGGFVRWLRAAGVLRREADGQSLELPVDAGADWIASDDFAVLGHHTLVIHADAGLVALPLDAGLEVDETFCAAGRARTVLRCTLPLVYFFDSFNGPRRLRACSLDVAQGAAGVSGCVEVPGRFVRQEPSSRHVLTLESGARLFSGALHGNRVEVPSEYLSGYFSDEALDDLHYGLSPLLYGARERSLVLTNESSQRWLFSTGLTAASADLAWRSDGGTTWWTVLP